MKGEDIFEALGEIDEEMLHKAQDYKKPKIRSWTKWLTAAACLCAVGAGVGIFLSHNNPQNVDDHTESHNSIAQMIEDPNESSVTDGNVGSDTSVADDDKASKEIAVGEDYQEDIAVIPYWEDMTLAEQFCSFEYNGQNYFVRDSIIGDTARIGEKLGDITIRGYDEYNPEEEHFINAEIFMITDISSDFAIALKYENIDGYYPCKNMDYIPEDLQQFLSDSNLISEVRFGTIYSDYKDEDDSWHYIEYHGGDSAEIFDILFDGAENTPNVFDYDVYYESEYDISVDIPVLGIENISLSVTADGYVETNIVDCGAAFYVGTDRVNALAEYIGTNCSKNESIVVYDNDENSGGEYEEHSSPAYDPYLDSCTEEIIICE